MSRGGLSERESVGARGRMQTRGPSCVTGSGPACAGAGVRGVNCSGTDEELGSPLTEMEHSIFVWVSRWTEVFRKYHKYAVAQW